MEDRYLNFYHYVMECIDDEDFPPDYSDGTKYATMRANNRTIKFVAKPISDYAGCHILTVQK